MFILNGLYSLVSCGGPSFKNLSSSMRAKDCLFLFSAFVRNLSTLALLRSVSKLCRLDPGGVSTFPMGVLVPLIALFGVEEPLTPSSLPGMESEELFEDPLIPLSFRKGFLRNDIVMGL